MPIIEVDKIVIRKRHRKVDSKKVEQLAKSIDQSGLINPIIIAGDVLVAGAHRLAAFKLLGRDVITFANMGNIEDSDTCELIEIDENLFRNELSESERSEHLARRIELISKRNLPEQIEKVTKAKVKRREVAQDSPKVGAKVGQAAERAAIAEAKKEVAAIMGVNPKKISEAISNHNAVTNADLDRNKLEELNGVQYKRVADVAKKQGKEAAEAELDIQLAKNKNNSMPTPKKAIDTAQLAMNNMLRVKKLSDDDKIQAQCKKAIKEIEKIIIMLT